MDQILLRQCMECGSVYLTGAPAAGRIPRTCPHDCQAVVRDVTPMLAKMKGAA
jgi:hypothetical protein